MDLDKLLFNTYIISDKYYARLQKEGSYVFLNIEFSTTEEFTEFDKNEYDEIVAKEVTSDNIYTFLKCVNYGYSCPNNKIIIKYRVSKIYDGKLERIDKNSFNKIDLCFEDISWFFNEVEYFKIEPLDDKISFNGFNKEYVTSFGKIIVNNFNDIRQTEKEINIKNNFKFKFLFNNKICYIEAHKKIYIFRNLLLILGRRYFDIKTIKLNDVDLIDCYEEYLYNPLSKQYLEYLDRHTITLSEIANFGEVVTNFFEIYDKIISIIDSFFAQTKYILPDKVRFFNACSMIEDYVNLFLVKEAKENGEEEAANNKMEFIKKCVTDMINGKIIDEEKKVDVENIFDKHVRKNENLSFKEKVMALVKNVNNSFNFEDSEIKIIGDNFRDARRAFVHKGIFIDEIFSPYISIYCHFTEDLIYLNILKQIGVDITRSQFECVEFNYSKDNLTDIVKFDK